jgi:type VI secretion system secreted protein VgrG
MPRIAELLTPLGPDVLLFQSLRGREALGRLSECEVTALSTRNDIPLGDILGKSVTVQLERLDGRYRYHNGYVTRFAVGGMVGRLYEYRLTLHSWLWFLTRTTDCRIFQDKAAPDIIKEVFADHPAVAVFDVGLTAAYRKREYCVQYRETDFDFVSRLMEEEGIYYFVEHGNGRHTLKLVDGYAGHPTLDKKSIAYYPVGSPIRADEEYVSACTVSQSIQTGVVTLTDYDPLKPRADLTTRATIAERHERADYEVFEYPGEYRETAEGDHYARARIDELHAQFELADAECNVREVEPGRLFTLTNAPRRDADREYLIVSADYFIRDNAYEAVAQDTADFQCRMQLLQSRQQFRPARVTRRPFVRGPQTAVVVGPAGEEIYTDKYARVKVQFHWDRYGKHDENSSCWMRVSQPWAGRGWGSVSLPRIGQEVIVDFLEGDADQPIITGRVYNADNMPPYGLPGGGVVSGLKSNSTKGGGGYNEMSMDDTKSKEKITIHAQYDMGTTVEHDQTNTVKNDSTETIVKNAKIEISEGIYKHDVKTGTADYHVQGALTEKYDTTQQTTVKGAITIVSTGGPIAVSSDAVHVYINAATNIQLHVGASMIWMDSGGQINIKGVNVAINGSSSVTIKGGIVHSEADSEHQTKGAIVLSDGASTNTVKGGMVMLNP